MNFNGVTLYEGWKIAARLPEISADIPGMYDFEITLSDDAQTGEELIYIANSSEPSDDDYITEFYDDTGRKYQMSRKTRKSFSQYGSGRG